MTKNDDDGVFYVYDYFFLTICPYS